MLVIGSHASLDTLHGFDNAIRIRMVADVIRRTATNVLLVSFRRCEVQPKNGVVCVYGSSVVCLE